MTLREALRRGAERLEAVAVLRPDARRDAALLLRHVLGITQAQLLADPDRVLSSAEEAAFEAAIGRRVTCEPVQYIVGEKEFYGLAFAVTPAVLIPRPETEVLVEAVLEELDADTPLRIADIGTGSGAIAVALARHLPMASITALDLSAKALAVARQNAERHGVLSRLPLVRSDLFAALPAGEPPFDAVVSNPPYVAEGERAVMHPQVAEYEPEAALFAGLTGLDIYRRLVPEANARLREGGLLAMEIGHGQQSDLAALLAGWDDVRFVPDLQGIPRVAMARKP